MPKTTKMLGMDAKLSGVDEKGRSVTLSGGEPSVLEGALAGQRQSGNYRSSAEKPERRGTGTRKPARTPGRGSKTAQERRDK